MDLAQVVDEVRADDDGKRDLLLARDELLLRHGRLWFPRAAARDCPVGLAPTGWATTQLCQRLNIPTSYFKRCPEALRDDQFNHWIEHAERPQSRPERWRLRTRGDTLRGVLTERYTCLDNRDVLSTLAPLVEPQYQIGWFALTEESFHLRLVDPRLAREVLPHDRLVAGVHLANSLRAGQRGHARGAGTARRRPLQPRGARGGPGRAGPAATEGAGQAYVDSPAFAPQAELEAGLLKQLLPGAAGG